MQEIKTYTTKDLVLNVSKTYDPFVIDLSKWERYLDALSQNRPFQKEAIETAIVYLASGTYNSIEDLVSANWQNNSEIQNKYRDLDEYLQHIQLPGKLSGTIDLATGTGKSYVIYGIAQIMLSLGIVDKVLVLCPSLTIESGLIDKFAALSGDDKLRSFIPNDSKHKNPRIIDANSTIKDGDICVENIHAVYKSTGSSINDSLTGLGQSVLVLNDEVHHVFNKVSGRDLNSRSIKKWKEFLLSNDYNFKYMLGFTGTAYIEDDYFNDVIYRYSLRQAVDDKIVKMVDYVSKDETIETQEKLQKIYDNHLENKNKYFKIKPLTILVTKDIKNAKRLASKVGEFISQKEYLSEEEASEKILVVTSAKEHESNILKLKYVDRTESSAEWIVSVSMLTEGWDVKNVFQIVPWEDRAFNSKLLIAQVLGRGLRIPEEYKSPQPRVRVFNHDAWSRNIKGLVDEILEIEMRLTSSILTEGDRAIYNFELYKIDYDKEPIIKEAKTDTEIFDYTKGYIDLISQVEEICKETEYTNLYGEQISKKTLIEYNSYSIDEVVNKIFEEFKTREWEGKVLKLNEGEYTKNELPPKHVIKKLIAKSMEKCGIKGERLTDKNRQKILQAFGTLLRKKGKTIVNLRKVSTPVKLSTTTMFNETMSIGNLKRGCSVFFTDGYKNELFGENKDILEDIINDESLARGAVKQKNPYLMKTPMDIIFSKSEPEKRFIENLCSKENVETIEAWIKSRDQRFYGIEFTWRKGEHSKQQLFSPDFFVSVTSNLVNYIVVVEIKHDNDDSDENKAKYRWAKKYFSDLNKELQTNDINQQYLLHFLSPVNYSEFFQYLRDGRLLKGEFRSELEDLLDGNDNGNSKQ